MTKCNYCENQTDYRGAIGESTCKGCLSELGVGNPNLKHMYRALESRLEKLEEVISHAGIDVDELLEENF